MKEKYLELLQQAEDKKTLTGEIQKEIMAEIVRFAEELIMLDECYRGRGDIVFEGRNDYGYNLAIAVSRGYGFTINVCWSQDSIWCYKDHGFVHPNLAMCTGEDAKQLIYRLGKCALLWAIGDIISDELKVDEKIKTLYLK